MYSYRHCSSSTHISLAQVPDISQSLLDFPRTGNRQTYEYWEMPGMLRLLVDYHSGVYGVASDAPAAAGSVCTERLYAESMHSSSSAAGMAGEAKLLSLIRPSHGEPKPSSSLCKETTNKMDNLFLRPRTTTMLAFLRHSGCLLKCCSSATTALVSSCKWTLVMYPCTVA